MTSTLDNILSNPGFIDIRDQIFGYFDHETLEVCCEVFAQRFGEDWDVWLKRLASIQYMVEFGDQMVEFPRGKTVKDIIPGWDKGVKTFGNMASLTDLNEVKVSMKELLNLRGMCSDNPVYLSAMDGHVKLLELLCHTDFDFKQSIDRPLIVACKEGSTEIVNLLVNSSKEFGIDLNARNDNGGTGFTWACRQGHTEIVNLMINSSKEFGIDLNARNDCGETGFMWACNRGRTEIVKLMINSSKEFGIDLNARKGNGDTGFMWACDYGHTEIVKLMIISSKDFGINLNARDDDGFTGFMWARRFGHTEIVTLMVNASKEFDINIDT